MDRGWDEGHSGQGKGLPAPNVTINIIEGQAVPQLPPGDDDNIIDSTASEV